MTTYRPLSLLLLILSLAPPVLSAAADSQATGETVAEAKPEGQPASPPAVEPAPTSKAPAASAASIKLPPSSDRPPKHLKFVDGHWTPYDPPKVPDGAKPYVIVPRDTLWDLSARFNSDPMLWPQIWDQNRYILDTHWIYPGDPLMVPPPPTVVPPAGTAVMTPAATEGMQEAPAVAEAHAPAPPQPRALADKQDLYCSDYIDTDYTRPAMKIAGIDEEAKVSQGEGDVVYINRGTKDGVATGNEYDIIRPVMDVEDPGTREPLGVLVSRRGRLRVIAVEPETATALITSSCIDILKGDRLVPKWDPEAPVGFPAAAMNRYGTPASGKAHGYIVAAPNSIPTMAPGHVVQIDLGMQAGLRPGDRVFIFRPNEEGDSYARKLLGTGMVVTARPNTAAVKITESDREVYIGDRVEVQ